MPVFPFFQFPYSRYYQRYNYNNSSYTNHSNNINNEKKYTSSINDNNFFNNYTNELKYKSSRYSSFGPIAFQNPFELDNTQPVLEILGISLYLDDLIILGLLFFLYKEEVHDEMLFLILILLLLT